MRKLFAMVLGVAWLSFCLAALAQDSTEEPIASTPDIQIANTVLSDGSFRYSVPINVPVFRGLEPNLNLRYVSSFNGFGTPNAVLGAGWRLSALSTIERVSAGGGTPTYADADDVFRMDGVELMQCNDAAAINISSRSYPADRKTTQESASCSSGGNYVTAVENYRKILFSDNVFYVTHKDGTERQYRSMADLSDQQPTAGTDAEKILTHSRFLLASVADVHGNRVEYLYSFGNSSEGYTPRLSKISYTLPDSTVIYAVQLQYEEIPSNSAQPTYATGTDLFGQQNYRLNSIRTYEGDLQLPIRAHGLAYIEAATTKVSLLSSVTEYGSDFSADSTGITGGTVLAQPYSFGYSPDTIGFESITDSSGKFDKPITVLDLYQNGHQQILVNTDWDSRQLRLYRASASRDVYEHDVTNTLENLVEDNSFNVFSGDATWNALTLFSRYDPASEQTFFNYSHVFRRANEECNSEGCEFRGFNYTHTHYVGGITPATSAAELSWAPTHYGNFAYGTELEAIANGDVYEVSSTGRLSSKTELGSQKVEAVADIDGDGYDEIFGGSGGSWSYSDPKPSGGFTRTTASNPTDGLSSTVKTGYGDVNGDGAVDLIIFEPKASSSASDGQIRVHLSVGSHFGAGSSWYTLSSTLTAPEIQVRDMNGDGLADIVLSTRCSSSTSTCISGQFKSDIYVSTGAGFTLATVSGTTAVGPSRGMALDFDGDGIGDIAGKDVKRHLFGTTGFKNILTNLTEPLGQEIAVTYKPSAHYSNNKVPRSYPVVSQITRTTAGLASQSRTTDYSYVNNLFDYERRQTVGFRTVTATLPAIDGETTRPQLITTYEQDVSGGTSDQALKGRIKSRTLIQDGVTYAQEINTWTSSGLSARPQRAWKTQTEIKRRYGTELVSRAKTYSRNLYGEVTRVTDFGFDGGGDDVTTWIDYNISPDLYIVGTPQREVIIAGETWSDAPADWLSATYSLYDNEAEPGSVAPVKGQVTELRRMRRDDQNTAYAQTTGTYSYDAWGNLLTETDAKSRTTSFTYDSQKNLFLTSTTNAAGHTGSATWDPACQTPLTKTDANGLVTNITLDLFCRQVLQRAPNGHEVSVSYLNLGMADAQYIETRAASATAGDTVTREYFDGFGQVYKTTSSGHTDQIEDAIVSLAGYDARGNLSWQSLPLSWDDAVDSAVDPAQQVIFTYDPLDRPLVTTNADGSQVVQSYETTFMDRWGASIAAPTIRVQDEACFDGDTNTLCGETWTVTDARGQVVRVDRSDPEQSGEGIQPLLAGHEDPVREDVPLTYGGSVSGRESTSIIEFDLTGYNTGTVSSEVTLPVSSYSYYHSVALNDVIIAESFRYRPLYFDISQYSNLIVSGVNTITSSGHRGTYTSRNSYIPQSSDRDVEEGGSTYIHHPSVTLTAVPLLGAPIYRYGVSTEYFFDLQGNLVVITDPGGAQWSYTYDAVGNRLTANDPGLGFWTLSYDETDNLLLQTDAKGQTIAYTYDALDRVRSKAVSEIRHGIVGFGPIQTTAQNAGGDSSNPPDHSGLPLPIDLKDQIVGLVTIVSTDYTYDEARNGFHNIGKLTTVSPRGWRSHSIEYDYNDQGLLTREHHTIDRYLSTSRAYTLETEYAANGLPLRRSLPDTPGATNTRWTDSFTYDAANRLTGFGSYITGVEYDLRSNPIEITYGNGLRSATEYSPTRGWMNKTELRDSSSLTMAKTEYGRTATGRVIQQWTTQDHGNLNYTYDYAGRLTEVSNRDGITSFDQSFTYDAAGNMTSNSHVGDYTYAAGTHRPISVNEEVFAYDANGNMTQGLFGKVMAYDGENRPRSVTYNGVKTEYVYGADGTRLKKIDNVGLPTETVTVTFGDVEIRNYGQGAAEEIITYPHPDVRLVNGAPSYLHRDQLNSVRVITGDDGAEDKRSHYHPFGKTIDWVSDPFATKETKGFIGERFDAGAGLQYLNARYYDTDLAMFIQPDWFEVTQPGVGTNRYSYSFNDPVNLSDSEGNAIDRAGSLKSDSLDEGGEGRGVSDNASDDSPSDGVEVAGPTGAAGKALKELTEAQKKKALKGKLAYARQLAVETAWRMEQQMVAAGYRGSRNWNSTQKKELLERGKVTGYEGHHINTVNGNLSKAADPSNIEFRTNTEHRAIHAAAGGYRTPISGQETIDRTMGGALPDLTTDYSKNWSETVRDYGLGVLSGVGIGLEVMDQIDPVFGPNGVFGASPVACGTLDC